MKKGVVGLRSSILCCVCARIWGTRWRKKELKGECRASVMMKKPEKKGKRGAEQGKEKILVIDLKINTSSSVK